MWLNITMNSKILELFGQSTEQAGVNWQDVILRQHCPYLDRTCVKVRKSQPEIAIGTCSVQYGVKDTVGMIICPHRLLDRKQIFLDCLHLLTFHEPGNELHRVMEVDIPGGSVDYVLASVKDGKIIDFVGIELQALDTTGTLWPERQRFLQEAGVEYIVESSKPYGMNWKMTAKTTLVQLHHKIETFQHVNRHLVLVLQDALLDYMQREFSFGHVQRAKLGDPMHFHAYSFKRIDNQLQLSLSTRLSTDVQGIATCLGLYASPSVELETIFAALQAKISPRTLLTI
jgi:hypothetical protein